MFALAVTLRSRVELVLPRSGRPAPVSLRGLIVETGPVSSAATREALRRLGQWLEDVQT
jgi:hypothetical protein